MKTKIAIIVCLMGLIGIPTAAIITFNLTNRRAKYNPLNCCIQEIHTHENYDCEWSYTYNEVHDYDDSEKDNVKCYVINCYVNDRVGEWFCYFIDYQDYYYIDCDLAREWIIE